ncbi:MAG: HEAT repeat domain-containing protein [Planctomycetota bacterium]|jgi:Mg-chelatase subunit ChlD
MGRRAAVLLFLAGTVLGAGLKFKDLFDPSRFPLGRYTWKDWEDIDAVWKDLEEKRKKLEEELGEERSEEDEKRLAEAKAKEEEEKRKAKRRKLLAKGVDPAEWDDPPPDTEEEKKKKEERRKKAEEETKKALGGRPMAKYPGNRYPGFRFERRLRDKRQAFETIVQPASASKLEGIVKQLRFIDKQADKYGKVINEAAEEYVQLKEQMDKATEWQRKKHQKKYGKPPKVVMVPAQLKADLQKASKSLQRLVATQQSERQFEEWFVDRLAALLNELTAEEVGKPLAALVKGLQAKDYRLRVRCAELLGRLRQPPARDAFQAALQKEQDPMVLAEMVRVRAKGGNREIVALLAKRLEDPRWPVRAAVITELGRIPHKDAVDVLVRQMAKEKGRLLDDIATALKDMTRQRYGPEPDPWRIWWEKVRDKWTPPPPDARAGEEKVGVEKGAFVYFYGIRTTSKRIVFCIDFSGSMHFPLDGEGGSEPPRIDTAKRELLQALAALPEDAKFNLVVYNSNVFVWKKTMQPATLRNKQVARKFIEKQRPDGATNIYDALNKSLDIAAAGSTAKRKAKDVPVADTIFFLTDGVPTNGRVVDPAQILKEVTARNRLLDVVIHTVGVSQDQNAGFLLNLAKQNRGRYVAHK